MEILIAGLALWSFVHFVPSVVPGWKLRWQSALGVGGYKGTFALLIVSALGLMIYGWRHTTPEFVYVLPAYTRPLTMLLMVFALLLFVAANTPTRIKRCIRHPQLTGVLLWSIAHLLSNGESRSIVLFGGLGLWALLETWLISRREGVWQKPQAPNWGQEIRGLAVSIVVVVVLIFAHPYLSGVALM